MVDVKSYTERQQVALSPVIMSEAILTAIFPIFADSAGGVSRGIPHDLCQAGDSASGGDSSGAVNSPE